MSRAFADAPSPSAVAQSDGEHASEPRAVSLELQLWIEVALLIVFGLVMIYSSSSVMAVRKFADSTYYVKRQLACAGMGVVIMLIVSNIPYPVYRHLAPWLLLLALVSLVLVLIPEIGVEINNARRWFRIGSLSLQPAEFAKVAWIIYLGVFLEKKRDRIRQFKIGFLAPLAVCGALGGLILEEPDFGTSFVLGILTASMLAVGGVPWHYLLSLVPLGFLGFHQFVYQVQYRWERITSFLNPWTDPLDSGYQLIQAWIAVGSGGLFGKGLGAGEQKLFYLPEPFTDFILAVIGEELGFVGILSVSVAFFLLARTGFQIALGARDFLGGLLALGLTLMISVQALINMCVVLGLFPTKGLPLPFISFGGSAFTANCLAVGILMSVARRCVK